MPLSATLCPAVMAIIIGHIAPHFLPVADGDLHAARQAATAMLAAYDPQTEAELAAAAEIIGLSFHTLEALGQAADPDLALNKVLRLRGGAVSLSRESHKAHRRLDQLQRSRPVAVPDNLAARTQDIGEPQSPAKTQTPAETLAPVETQSPAEPTSPPEPAEHPAPEKVHALPPPATARTPSIPRQAWTTAQQKRHAAYRMTEILKRNQAEHARREAARSAVVCLEAAEQPRNDQAAPSA